MSDLIHRSPEDLAAHLATEYRVASLDELQAALDVYRRAVPLRRIVDAFQLSNTEAGRLFGVSRQAFTKWLKGQVPADRRVEVADLAAAADCLLRMLHRDAVPAVIRRPSASLDGRTLMDILAEEGAGAFHRQVRAMFAFGDAHG